MWETLKALSWELTVVEALAIMVVWTYFARQPKGTNDRKFAKYLAIAVTFFALLFFSIDLWKSYDASRPPSTSLDPSYD